MHLGNDYFDSTNVCETVVVVRENCLTQLAVHCLSAFVGKIKKIFGYILICHDDQSGLGKSQLEAYYISKDRTSAS